MVFSPALSEEVAFVSSGQQDSAGVVQLLPLHHLEKRVLFLESVGAVDFDTCAKLELLLVFVEKRLRIDGRLDVLQFVVKPKVFLGDVLQSLDPLGVVHRGQHLEPSVVVPRMRRGLHEPLALRHQ